MKTRNLRLTNPYCKSHFGSKLNLFYIFMLLGVLGAYPGFSPAAEREEELAGDHEVVQEKMKEPEIQEPKREEAGVNQARPTLKLPEVVVTGEKQYRVTAERRDFLFTDPMQGTKDVPEDLSRDKIPGLAESKGAPAADTVTVKNYLLSLEADAGTSRIGDARLVAGYEWEAVNFILRSDYACGANPEAYHFIPFGQQGGANLDIGVNFSPGIRLIASALAKGGTHSQPEQTSLGWGDWLQQTEGEGKLLGELELGASTALKLTARYNQFQESGAAPLADSRLLARLLETRAEIEKGVDLFSENDLSCWLEIARLHQDTEFRTDVNHQVEEDFFQDLQARLRFRPIRMIYFDVGVKMDEFNGRGHDNTSDVVGKLSLMLPDGIVLFGGVDAGLTWMPASVWGFQQPHQTFFNLPESERIIRSYEAGWKQSFHENFNTQISWSRKSLEHSLVWLDLEEDGLFSLMRLEPAQIESWEAKLEARYSEIISQSFAYYYRRADAGPARVYPYLPVHEGETELRIQYNRFTFSLAYHFLGSRSSGILAENAQLESAHLVGAGCDVKLTEQFHVFIKGENLLNDAWETWRGYPGRSLTVRGGLGLNIN